MGYQNILIQINTNFQSSVTSLLYAKYCADPKKKQKSHLPLWRQMGDFGSLFELGYQQDIKYDVRKDMFCGFDGNLAILWVDLNIA